MRIGSLVLTLIIAGQLCAAPPATQPALLRQVQAEDTLSGLLVTQTHDAARQADSLNAYLQHIGHADAHRQTSTPPHQRLPYDQALRGAVQYIDSGGARSADPAIAQMSEAELRHELVTLHLHNQELYLDLNHRQDQILSITAYLHDAGRYQDYLDWSRGRQPDPPPPATRRIAQSANEVAQHLAKMESATTRPARSRPPDSLLSLDRNPPPEPSPQQHTMDQAQADAARAQQMEQPDIRQMSPQQIASALIAGQPLPGSFGVPNIIAPLNARRPGSQELTLPNQRTMPLSANVPNTLALRATPPGTPESVVPSPEVIQQLANMLGISPQEAEAVAMGAADPAKASQSGSANEPATGVSMDAQTPQLSANDPRWGEFYYGPARSRNNWRQTYTQPFLFAPGGGIYSQADRRVNRDPDMRINGNPDRRVNISNDRRTNIQVDPRTNY